ncbi:MAG TPA: hypothetical protein VKM54_12880 [Myxococcota bacterium]|nr:hypothetical protein [Myxococcota bacterium]
MDLAAVAAARFRLSDAQLVVAREYGVESWPRLVALVGFLRVDLSERARLFTEAAVGEGSKRAHDLLARAPELAAASFQAACAAGDQAVALHWLAKDAAAATRADGPRGAEPLWRCGPWSGSDDTAKGTRHAVALVIGQECVDSTCRALPRALRARHLAHGVVGRRGRLPPAGVVVRGVYARRPYVRYSHEKDTSGRAGNR